MSSHDNKYRYSQEAGQYVKVRHLDPGEHRENHQKAYSNFVDIVLDEETARLHKSQNSGHLTIEDRQNLLEKRLKELEENERTIADLTTQLANSRANSKQKSVKENSNTLEAEITSANNHAWKDDRYSNRSLASTALPMMPESDYEIISSFNNYPNTADTELSKYMKNANELPRRGSRTHRISVLDKAEQLLKERKNQDIDSSSEDEYKQSHDRNRKHKHARHKNKRHDSNRVPQRSSPREKTPPRKRTPPRERTPPRNRTPSRERTPPRKRSPHRERARTPSDRTRHRDVFETSEITRHRARSPSIGRVRHGSKSPSIDRVRHRAKSPSIDRARHRARSPSRDRSRPRARTPSRSREQYRDRTPRRDKSLPRHKTQPRESTPSTDRTPPRTPPKRRNRHRRASQKLYVAPRSLSPPSDTEYKEVPESVDSDTASVVTYTSFRASRRSYIPSSVKVR